jgi:alpha-beta hydrolase superfamily lysophospholipase
MLRIILLILVLIVVVYVGAAIYLYRSQSSFVYYPSRQILSTPKEHGLAYQDVMLQTVDSVAIHGWYVPADSPRGTVLFCHGNGGNISHTIESVAMLHGIGFNVFVFDYRGYGRSGGEVDEEGTYRDAEAAWSYLTGERGCDPSRIVVLGRSLGGGIASWIAAQHSVGALILESTFTSIPDMGAGMFPIFPVRLLSRIHYDTEKRLGAIHSPVLVIHSRTDDVISFKHGAALFGRANEPKEFLEITGDHNMGFHASQRVYIEGIIAFLEKYIDSDSPRSWKGVSQ